MIIRTTGVLAFVFFLGLCGWNLVYSATVTPLPDGHGRYPGGSNGIVGRMEGNVPPRPTSVVPNMDPSGEFVSIERARALGRSWYVSENGSDSEGDGSSGLPFASIQHAMDQATSGDTVVVACGTYFESNIGLQAGVTLISETGEASCVTIDAQQQTFAMGCIFSNDIRVEGLTVVNGSSSHAGAMWFGYTTNISVINCNLNNNSATQMGGGIYCVDSEMTVRNLTVSDNYAGWQGSGIAMNDGGSAIIQNSIVSNNDGSVALYCISDEIIDLFCSNIFGNSEGDWVGCVQSDQDSNGNMSTDPLYCDRAMGGYNLASESPCAAGNNLECGQVGALGVGCSVSGAVEQSLVRKYHLLPCYPNPFNPYTTIAFEIPGQQDVTLRVFDLSGRLVRDLIAGETYTGGRHEVTWNGRDEDGRLASSGTYFYRLDAGSYSETKRMVLIK